MKKFYTTFKTQGSICKTHIVIKIVDSIPGIAFKFNINAPPSLVNSHPTKGANLIFTLELQQF